MLFINLLRNSPCWGASFSFEELLLFFHLEVFIRIITQINSSIKNDPCFHIIWSLKVPVHQYMSCWVSVHNCVAVRKQGSSVSKIDSKIAEWLICSSSVSCSSSNNIFWFSLSNRRGESSYLSNCMGILPNACFTISSKPIKGAIVVKVIRINKFIRCSNISFNLSCLCGWFFLFNSICLWRSDVCSLLRNCMSRLKARSVIQILIKSIVSSKALPIVCSSQRSNRLGSSHCLNFKVLSMSWVGVIKSTLRIRLLKLLLLNYRGLGRRVVLVRVKMCLVHLRR